MRNLNLLKGYKYLAFFFLITVISCRNSTYNVSTINIKIANSKIAKIYLIDTFDSRKLLDSSELTNGQFNLSYNFQKHHTDPFLVSLMFINAKGKKEFLIINNKLLSTNRKIINTSAFMLERTPIKITGDDKNMSAGLELLGGEQNESMFKNQTADFGFLSEMGIKNRRNIIIKYESIVKNNPNSYFLLFWLNANRTSYTKSEIVMITSAFNQKIKDSKSYLDIKRYLKNYEKTDINIRQLKLKNSNQKNEKIVDPTAKLTMIVFWASWCRPCIREIPTLKKIQEIYKSNKFNLVSISIDKNEQEWKKSLALENMPWKQFITNKEELIRLQSDFKFSSIPLIIFVDDHAKEVKRIASMSDSNTKLLYSFLDKELK